MTTYATTHYETLRVPPSASDEQIRVAYRQLVKVTHPDAGGAIDEFRALQEAWDVLKEPASRQRYDDDLRWASATSSSGSHGHRDAGTGPVGRTEPAWQRDQRLCGEAHGAHEYERTRDRADLDRRAGNRRAERERRAEQARRAEHLLQAEAEREAARAGINYYAAINAESPEELLVSLASDPSPVVRAAVAANPATPGPVIRVLTSDVDRSVATAAAAERDRRKADPRSGSAASRWFRSPRRARH